MNPGSSTNGQGYDAVLIVAFGGPEGMEEVMPFLENVLRGRNVPRERMLEVAEHYRQFDGVSPINQQIRTLMAALKEELATNGPHLPVYWGNRNWHPFLADTIRQMADDGVRRALGFFTSPYSSYSSCRQYWENIADARQKAGPDAPHIDKLQAFYNHPGFIRPNIEHAQAALQQIPAGRRANARLVFTAHSIPLPMAHSSAYERQLRETARLIAEGTGHEWDLVYQSRSGPPHQPWLEPDICDHLETLKTAGVRDVVVSPLGFISDHLEVLYDLDIAARRVAEASGLNMVRAATVGTHPEFVRMIRELIVERMSSHAERRYLGTHGPSHDVCPADCCLPVSRGPAQRPGQTYPDPARVDRPH